MASKLFFISFLILILNTANAGHDLQDFINNDKAKIDRMLLETNRSFLSKCGSKVKFELDYTELDALEINDKVNKFERLKKHLDSSLETFMSLCKQSKYKSNFQKIKKVNFVAVNAGTWKVLDRGSNLNVQIGTNPGKNFSDLLEKKLK